MSSCPSHCCAASMWVLWMMVVGEFNLFSFLSSWVERLNFLQWDGEWWAELSHAELSGSPLPASVACLAKANWLPNSQRQSRDESELTRWSLLHVHWLTAPVLREMETQHITLGHYREGGGGGSEGVREKVQVQNGFWTPKTLLAERGQVLSTDVEQSECYCMSVK